VSHFTVLVIGDDPEHQLAPYDESLECEPYRQQQVTEEDWARFVNYYKARESSPSTLTREQLYDLHGGEWNKRAWKFEGGEWWEDTTYNFESKWDWYQLGGRWTGYFKLKEGRTGLVGNTEVFDNQVREGWVDRAAIGDIDFEGMRLDAAEGARKLYKQVIKVAGGPIKAPKRSWKEFLDDGSYGGDYDKRRQDYWIQPEIRVWKKVQDKCNLFLTPIKEFLVTEEEYVQKRAKAAIVTYAVVKDGKWYEKGEMGWFGCSSNEKAHDDWVDEFYSLLDSLPEDTILSLYDCHI